jgi:hypothetical protein
VTRELKLRSIRVGDIVEQDEEHEATIVQVCTSPGDGLDDASQIPLEEILSNKKALAPYLKAISQMYDDLGGCVEELNPTSGGGCFALFRVVRLSIVSVVIVEQVPICSSLSYLPLNRSPSISSPLN